MAEEKKDTTAVQEVEATVKEEKTVPASKSSDQNADSLAIASLAMGILSLCGSFCGGICCIPFSLLGVVFGIMGMKSEKNKMIATIGLALSAISIVAIILFAIFGTLINLSSYYNDL